MSRFIVLQNQVGFIDHGVAERWITAAVICAEIEDLLD